MAATFSPVSGPGRVTVDTSFRGQVTVTSRTAKSPPSSGQSASTKHSTLRTSSASSASAARTRPALLQTGVHEPGAVTAADEHRTLVDLNPALLPADHEKVVRDRYDSAEALFDAAEAYLRRWGSRRLSTAQARARP